MGTRPSKKRRRRNRLGLLALPLFLIAILALGIGGIDQLCVADAERRLPYYPGSERVEESHNGLRVRGIGNSLEVGFTPDDLETVQAWYDQLTIELLNSGRPRGVNNLIRRLEANAEGEGTFIFYLTQCVM